MRKRLSTAMIALGILTALAGCNKSSTNDSGSSGSSAQNAAPSAPPVVVDAGQTLTVALNQPISTKTNNTGDHFDASVAEPVTVNGAVVIPQGSRASGTVVTAQSAGHLKGSAELALTLDSITVNGQTYSVQTSEFEEATKGRGKRSLIGGGGGAAFGGIVGALAGGGKGAAIGALAGGGAGTAGAAFTGKRDFTVPAETRLHFRLKEPLTINQQ